MKKALDKPKKVCYNNPRQFAGVMELADVRDSKSRGSDTVWVRPPPPAPKIPNVRAFGIFTFSVFILSVKFICGEKRVFSSLFFVDFLWEM